MLSAGPIGDAEMPDDQLTEFGRLRTSGLTVQLPRPDMERHLAAFLHQGNVCVLATCLNDVPRATPIEYYADGLTIYVAASRATKVPNIEGNPHVSVAIYSRPYTDWTDWYDVTGIQMTGAPELLRYDERPEEYVAALQYLRLAQIPARTRQWTTRNRVGRRSSGSTRSR